MTRAATVAGFALLALAAVMAVCRPARPHDIYHDWKTHQGISCCHDRDCAPATAWTDAEDNLYMRQDGKIYPVPKHTILSIPSPDGRSHLCVIAGIPICAVVGPPRS